MYEQANTNRFTGWRSACVAAILLGPWADAYAVSFSADVIQIRGDEISQGRVFWSDDRVRFEYFDQGVQMARIFDAPHNRVIWLDTEKKIYLQREFANRADVHSTGKTANAKAGPCDVFVKAECVKLKSVKINDRKTDKWLITFNVNGRDEHMFQWVDKALHIPVRQENPDGSIVDVQIIDGLELEGRKVYKVDSTTFTPDGKRNRGIQWYDKELQVVVRQQDDDGTVEELRNIRLQPVADEQFTIPEGYEALDTRLSAPDGGSSIIFKTAQN